MRVPGAPLRFLGFVVGLWGAGRVWWLVGEQVEAVAVASAPSPDFEGRAGQGGDTKLQWFSPIAAERPSQYDLTILLPPVRAGVPLESQPDYPSSTPLMQVAARGEILSPEAPSPSPRLSLPQAVAEASRWSGSAWVFVREKSGGRSLAGFGQLGGSQTGARLRWRINPGQQVRTALNGRLSAPLDDRAGAEAAVGAEWHPMPGTPFWIAAERRIALGKHGRDAWSAYAAGGIWRPGLPLDFILDGYAQAGVVGARKRDLFADGAIRLSKAISPQGPRLGMGMWGAAQPGAMRLDIGPHASIPIKVAKQPLSISADYRIRVAGDVTPGSGVAVTLASDF